MKRVLIVAAAILLYVAPARAQFGGVTFDPTTNASVIASKVAEVAQLSHQVSQLLTMYNLTKQAYTNILNMPARYRGTFANWRNLTNMVDRYGNAGQWQSAANTGVLGSAYQAATNPLNAYPTYGSMNSGAQGRMATRYANIEIPDAANQSSLGTIGQIRSDATQIDSQTSNLENDSLSDSVSTNEVGVLQKQNATQILMLRTLSDQSKLQAAQAEAQLLASKKARDDEVAAINTQGLYQANIGPQTAAATTGLGNVLGSFSVQ